MVDLETVHVIGAGLAGSEAAWQLAQRGVPVRLYEMRPGRMTPAHCSDRCAELVCSNSLRSDDPVRNGSGVLHQEMRMLGSLVMEVAEQHRVPAGSALAVDRDAFAAAITARLEAHPRITLIREEVTAPPREGWTLIASGPLTSDGLAQWLEESLGQRRLDFFDAIAPIVTLESIDFTKAWKQSRYDRGNDYINCPMDRAQYDAFVEAILTAEKVPLREFEKTPFFERCMPIEVMAGRGRESLRFGPMRPVGLSNPHRPGERPYAVVQLRQDNRAGTLWNMVGFQTKMTWPEQRRLFRTIAGLEEAEFVRLGSLHRNTFIDSPRMLTPLLQLRGHPRLLLAGQLIGVEGYLESAAMGLLAALFLADLVRGGTPVPPPPTTAHGALLAYVTGESVARSFQPMSIHFGLFPPAPEEIKGKGERKMAQGERALRDLTAWREQVAVF